MMEQEKVKQCFDEVELRSYRIHHRGALVALARHATSVSTRSARFRAVRGSAAVISGVEPPTWRISVASRTQSVSSCRK